MPVHIDGTYRIWPRGGKRLRRSPTRITFGSPITAAEGEDARRLEARIDAVLGVLAALNKRVPDWWTRWVAGRGGRDPVAPGGPTCRRRRRAWALGPDPQGTDEDDETR